MPERSLAGHDALAEVVLVLPRVLTDLAGCAREVVVRGASVEAALGALVDREPKLRIHLFDDTGALRRHILCFRNGVGIEHRAALSQPLESGDSLRIVNSVAGG